MEASSNGRSGGVNGHARSHLKSKLTAADYDFLAANMLNCQICKQIYSDPCVLSCYHTFCAKCVRGRVDPKEGHVLCPICGLISAIGDESSLPPKDELVDFLLQTSSDDFPTCSNCDRNERSTVYYCNTCVCWSSQRECDHLLSLINSETGLLLGDVASISMFYCNTCGQALCGPCREDTHKAKMFSLHDIIHISMKVKKHSQKCPSHGEILTMFCTSNKSLLCMKCFSEASLETRLHCVDIDIAYEQGKKRLDRTIMTIRELQSSLRDTSMFLQTMVEEVKKNMVREREEIHATYTNLYDTIRKQYESVLRSFDSEYQGKSLQLAKQLQSTTISLPVIQVHLLLCSVFSSRASKYEFLGLSTYLVERLANLARATYPNKLPTSTELLSSFKQDFIASLDDILQGVRDDTAQVQRQEKPPEPKEEENYFDKCSHILKLQLESLSHELSDIRGQMSLLHREISSKRCLSDSSVPVVSTLSHDCRETKTNLDRVRQLVDEQGRVLAAIWEEDERRIRMERETFNKQFTELKTMHNDLCHIICLSDHLSSFAKSGRIDLEHESAVYPRHSKRGELNNSCQTLPAKRKTEQQQQQHLRSASGASRGNQHTLPRSTGGDRHFPAQVHLPECPVETENGLRRRRRSDSRLSYCSSSEDLPVRDSQACWDIQQQLLLPSTIPSPIDQEKIDQFLRNSELRDFRSRRDEDKRMDKPAAIEPPVLGKSPRVAPVNLASEEPERLSAAAADSCQESSDGGGGAVEVVSLIRFNKNKQTCCSSPSSSSDTNSIFNPSLMFETEGSPFNTIRAKRTQLPPPPSHHLRHPEDGSAAAGHLRYEPLPRRSSAPEIDQEHFLSGLISPGLQSRSLDHLKENTGSDTSDSEGPPQRLPPSLRSRESLRQVRAVVHHSEQKTSRTSATAANGAATMKKRDSFEGHEEAVRTLVEALQETRKKEASRKRQE